MTALSIETQIRREKRGAAGATLFRQGSDERGAILVMGLFLALAAVSGIWCVIGIGDAILARETSQQAADSAAFSSAVVHARGMNLIAFINIIMLAMCIVYLTLTWVDLILSTALVLTGTFEPGPNWCVTHYWTWAFDVTINYCDYANRIGRIERPIYRADEQVFERMKRVGPPLFEVQVWAAQVVPYLGVTAANFTGIDYGRPLTVSLGLSNYPGGGAIRPLNELHLFDRFPGLRERPPQVTARDSQGRPIPATIVPRPGEAPLRNTLRDGRIGLPVEAQAAGELCVHAARLPLEWLQVSLARLADGSGGWSNFIGNEPMASILTFVNQSTGEFNKAMFCSAPDGPAPPNLPAIEGGSSPTQQQSTDLVVYALGSASNRLLYLAYQVLLWGARGGINEKFYLQPDQFWRANWPDPRSRRGTAYDEGYYAGPKRVVPYAYNGNDWMQVWAFALAERETASRGKWIVGQMARVFQPDLREPPGERSDSSFRTFFAQAEFYYDCNSSFQSSACNRAEAAMYQMKWRARLRRVRMPSVWRDLSELFFDNLITGQLGGMAGGALERFLGSAGRGAVTAISDVALLWFNHDLVGGATPDEGTLH